MYLDFFCIKFNSEQLFFKVIFDKIGIYCSVLFAQSEVGHTSIQESTSIVKFGYDTWNTLRKILIRIEEYLLISHWE